MLQILEFTKNNVIATKSSGKLTKSDIGIIHDRIHKILNEGQKVRWYFEMENFMGYGEGGLWEDLKMDLAHADDYEKIAMVGEQKWQEWMSQIMKPFTGAEIKYFDITERTRAKEWINQ